MRKATTVLVLLFVATLPLVNPWVRGDGVGYYAYVRSLLVEHKLDFQNDWRAANTSFTMGRVRADGSIDPQQYTRTGQLDNHFAVGASILWAPFEIPVHLTMVTLQKQGVHVKADGFSRPYIIAMALGTALYGFVGLYFSFRLAASYVDERWALLATIGIWFASSLPVYMYFNPSWSHAQSVFLVASFLFYWRLTRKERQPVQWMLLGLIAGLMLDVYYANIVLLLIVAIESLRSYWHIWRSIPRDWSGLGRLCIDNAVFGVATVLAFLPTLITRKIIYGEYGNLGYSGVVTWGSPRFARVLFSSDHGLLTWTPILIPALIGLALLYRFDRELSIATLGSFVLLWYLIACDHNWDGLSSFGNRFFISLAPLFVLGLGVSFSAVCTMFRAVNWGRAAFSALCAFTALLIAWNLAFIFQWGSHLIPVRGSISWKKMAMNQVSVVPSRMRHDLKAYFSRRSSLMQDIETKDVQQLKQETK
jgi:hypothetical protein